MNPNLPPNESDKLLPHYIVGPHHGSDSQCWKCHGKGKIYHC